MNKLGVLAVIIAAVVLAIGSYQYGTVKGEAAGYDAGLDDAEAKFKQQFTNTYEKGYLDCMNISAEYLKSELPKLMRKCECKPGCK